MTDEYIRKQDAINIANDWLLDCFKVQKQDRSCGLICRLEDSPPADVVQVRHGRWIKYTGMGKVQWMCSECSAEEKNPKVANYCYHCGAKMDAYGDE